MMALTASVVGVYAAHVPLSANPLNLPGENKTAMVKIFPQGWKFFTRDPRLAEPTPLRKVGDDWVPLENAGSATAANFFGASRQGRALGPELNWVLAPIAESEWQSCDGPAASCLAKAPTKQVETQLKHPQLCGSIGLVTRQPVPWAWAKRSPAVTMPSKVLRLEIRC